MQDHREQIAFFERLKEALPIHYNLANEIAEILGVSTDSVYRRIRGETALSYSELLKIQQHLNLKQNLLFPMTVVDEVNFEFSRPSYGYDTVLYLQNIYNQMNLLHRRHEMEITLASDDLPFFLHFLSPPLLQFKLMMFSGQEMDTVPGESNSSQIGNIVQTIVKRWLEANSVELWGSNPLDSTTRQIEYYCANHMITEEHATLLLSELYKLVDLIDEWARTGVKTFGNIAGGSIKLFQSELNLGEMTLNLNFGNEMATYKSNPGYGYLKTEHSKFCEETLAWMRDFSNKGIMISGAGERFRKRYIMSMKQHLDAAVKRMHLSLATSTA